MRRPEKDGRRGSGRPPHRRTGGPLNGPAPAQVVRPAARGHRTLVTPTDDPAGTIATRTAGSVEVHATLAWRGPEDLPTGLALPRPTGLFVLSVAETTDAAAATRTIAGEIHALTDDHLRHALEVFLRAVTQTAALTEAVLETSAVYRCRPQSPPAAGLQALARDLWEAGFPVRFAPCWRPLPVGGLALGVRGAEETLAEFLCDHDSWSLG